MKRFVYGKEHSTGGGLMKRNNVNRVLLNDFFRRGLHGLHGLHGLQCRYEYSKCNFLETKECSCNPCNPPAPEIFLYTNILSSILFFHFSVPGKPVPSLPPLISKVTQL